MNEVGLGVSELFILGFIVALLAIVVWPAMRICRRIGFSPLLGLLAVVPIANVVLLWFVALSPWPSSDRREGGA